MGIGTQPCPTQVVGSTGKAVVWLLQNKAEAFFEVRKNHHHLWDFCGADAILRGVGGLCSKADTSRFDYSVARN